MNNILDSAPELTASEKQAVDAIKMILDPNLLMQQMENESGYPAYLCSLWSRFWNPFCRWLLAQTGRKRPILLGIAGGQGSGKTTFASMATELLTGLYGLNVCHFSIDDIYHTRATRQKLAAEIHPLLATRGVPGTHDLELGNALLDQLQSADEQTTIQIPKFDKGIDDRLPRTKWSQQKGPFDLVIFEGWCVGAPPQSNGALMEAANSLEQKEDQQGSWRGYVNQRLATDYHEFFNRLDCLVFLRIPDFEAVQRWRTEQENNLLKQQGTAAKQGLKDEAAIARFIAHYQRITEHMRTTLPDLANLVIQLNSAHEYEHAWFNQAPKA